MSFLMPQKPPPAPAIPNMNAAAAAADQQAAQQRAALAKGQTEFNPTGGQGDPTAAPVVKKTLLGS